MRSRSPYPAALSRQLAEWRQPLDADPEVDAAVMRMLSAIDRLTQGKHEPQHSER